MKIKILYSIATLATIIVTITAPSFILHAMAAESDVPEPGDCPDPTDPLCPPATSSNQTGNITGSLSTNNTAVTTTTTK